jgi:hypothetical protein
MYNKSANTLILAPLIETEFIFLAILPSNKFEPQMTKNSIIKLIVKSCP